MSLTQKLRGWIDLVTNSGPSAVHVLDPDRYARTVCGLEDTFESGFQGKLVVWRGSLCGNCERRIWPA